ncbi:hypothetical protein PAMC26577_05450 [Caballeronia sordidicola]|uniref:Uncharacterized protein n=1 Tax=Caballeronia sordidicola TaxID=196367 RepID=A0A242N326_CABSO|nr:hypothetical protein PAMC26577_05450 [Caballeronia sordidicola]
MPFYINATAALHSACHEGPQLAIGKFFPFSALVKLANGKKRPP